MGDLISRQAAIDALMAILDRPNHAEFLYTDEICKALGQLPSAQPERKGKWIKPTGMMPPECFGRHQCSECDGFALHDWKHHKEQLTDFCPHCGARME